MMAVRRPRWRVRARHWWRWHWPLIRHDVVQSALLGLILLCVAGWVVLLLGLGVAW